MCYSFESSISAWLFSTIIAIAMWQRNNHYDRWFAGFILSFAFVQLWEAGIWAGGSTDLFVSLIVLTLAAQPLAQTIGAYNTTKSDALCLLGYMLVLFMFYSIYRVATEKFYSSVGPNGHLIWDSSDGGVVNGMPYMLKVLYLVGMIAGLLFILPDSIPLIIIGVGTFLYSLRYSGTQEFGSYWCFSAVLYSTVAYILNR